MKYYCLIWVFIFLLSCKALPVLSSQDNREPKAASTAVLLITCAPNGYNKVMDVLYRFPARDIQESFHQDYFAPQWSLRVYFEYMDPEIIQDLKKQLLTCPGMLGIHELKR